MDWLKKLHVQIIVGILLGGFGGYFFPEAGVFVEPMGSIFIRLITMIMVPLVFASLVVGVTSLADAKDVGKVGLKTLVYFVVTTFISIMVGLGVVNMVNPGINTDFHFENTVPVVAEQGVSAVDFIMEIVPDNVFYAFAHGKMLPIILFSVLFGMAILSIGSDGRDLVNGISALNDAMMKLTDWIMQLAPFGAFALMASFVAKMGMDAIMTLLLYVGCVLCGLLIHFFIVIPLIVRFVAQYSPVELGKRVFLALGTVFSTSSSAATLPITMDCLIKKVGISNRVTSFVLPLGTTINMDGTALYQAVAAIFIAQVYGVEIALYQYVVIAVTAILASIGAAGIPSAGLVTLVLILNSVHVPVEGIAIILGVDRLLDMCRSVVNVWGNVCGVVVIARLEGETYRE